MGSRNRDLVSKVSALLDRPYTSRQATYDLRRLRRKGLVVRRTHTQRYEPTPTGRRIAVLFTKAYGRVLTPALAILDPELPTDIGVRHPLAIAWRCVEHELDDYCHRTLLAA